MAELQRQSATLHQQLNARRAEAHQLQAQLSERAAQLESLSGQQTERDVLHAAALGIAAKSARQQQLQLTRAQRLAAELQQRLDARDAEYQSLLAATAKQTAAAQRRLVTVKAERFDAQADAAAAGQRIVTVKKEKLDAEADALGAAQQRDKAAAAKRKSEAELQEEAKRHRGTADHAAELAAANRRLEEEKDSLSLICAVCCDARPSVLYLPCKHLAVCGGCDGRLEQRGQSCPMCQAEVAQRHRKIHF